MTDDLSPGFVVQLRALAGELGVPPGDALAVLYSESCACHEWHKDGVHGWSHASTEQS
jgi:hypothetical protein